MEHYIVVFQDDGGKMLHFERVKKNRYKTAKGIKRATEKLYGEAIAASLKIYEGITKATQCTIYLTEYETTTDKIFCQFALNMIKEDI